MARLRCTMEPMSIEYRINPEAQLPGARLDTKLVPVDTISIVETDDEHLLKIRTLELERGTRILRLVEIEPPMPDLSLDTTEVHIKDSVIKKGQPFTLVTDRLQIIQPDLRAVAIISNIEPVTTPPEQV